MGPPFRNPQVAAPLKRLRRRPAPQAWRPFPQPSSCGSIEAGRKDADSDLAGNLSATLKLRLH